MHTSTEKQQGGGIRVRISTTASMLTLLALSIPWTGCLSNYRSTRWPDVRPLGREIRAYKAPEAFTEKAAEVKEPTGVLTLRAALALALLRNPSLQAFAWDVRAKEAMTLQAGLLPNPTLDVGVEEFAGTGDRRGFNAAQTTLQLSQRIELGGKRSSRHAVASLKRDLAAWNYEAKRLDVLTSTTKAFIGVLAAKRRLALLKESEGLAERVQKTAAMRVRAGKVSSLEETQATVALARNRIAVARAHRMHVAARRRLAAMWASRNPTFLRASGGLRSGGELPAKEELLKRLFQNPAVARWVTMMRQREAEVDLERSKRIPDVTVRGGIQRFEDAGDLAATVGISVPLPLFNRNQGAVSNARYRLAKAAHERRAAENMIRSAVDVTYQNLAAAHAEIQGLETGVLPGAKRAFEVATEGYRQGKFGILVVLDAHRTLLGAKEKHVEALASYHKGVAEMERLVGHPIITRPVFRLKAAKENDDVQ